MGDLKVSFKTFHPSFEEILGLSPEIKLLVEDPDGTSKYHEACVYDEASHSVFITSNQIALPDTQEDPATSNKVIIISRIYDSPDTDLSKVRVEDATPKDLPMGNGGVNYKSGILYCAQGNKNLSGKEGIVYVPSLEPPYTCHSLISTFHGRPFNSVNDVIVHPIDNSIWFTDPCYGHLQGIRPPPQLPNQVYRFDPETKDIRAIASDFMRPNGLCFSPDLSILYVTDTGAIFGDSRGIDPSGPSHIYAFDIVPSTHDKTQPFLTNRRLFAYAPGLLPDGIKTDMAGNVYSGCMDGVEVWNPSGLLIGTIVVEGGVANFCFGKEGAIYMCNETRVWRAQVGKHVKGALLGI